MSMPKPPANDNVFVTTEPTENNLLESFTFNVGTIKDRICLSYTFTTKRRRLAKLALWLMPKLGVRAAREAILLEGCNPTPECKFSIAVHQGYCHDNKEHPS